MKSSQSNICSCAHSCTYENKGYAHSELCLAAVWPMLRKEKCRAPMAVLSSTYNNKPRAPALFLGSSMAIPFYCLEESHSCHCAAYGCLL